MNKGVIYYTKIREEYKGAHMEHMIAEKLLEIGLKKEFGIDLEYEPRAEGEHGKPFLSFVRRFIIIQSFRRVCGMCSGR